MGRRTLLHASDEGGSDGETLNSRQPDFSSVVKGSRQCAFFRSETMMKKLFSAVTISLLLTSATFAQSPAAAPSAKPAAPAASASSSSSCEAQAVGKNGKPLTGAAKTSFMKKCEAGGASSASTTCESKAVGKNGKPLAGAAKDAFMKKCVADAGK